eukprot:COSAG01_NODE_33454_length_563_cov_7.116379_1_plen_22_part_01
MCWLAFILRKTFQLCKMFAQLW